MPTNNYLQTINDFLSNANFEYTYKLIICPSLIYGRKSEENHILLPNNYLAVWRKN